MDTYDDWVKHFNQRGHASRGHTTHETEDIVTLSILREWQSVVTEAFGLDVSNLSLNLNDPPDAFADVNGMRFGVELTEMVDGKLLSDLRKASRESGVRATSSHGAAFRRSQWTKDRLLGELSSRIGAKQESYERHGVWIDFLVIHTDEPWLSRGQAKEWLQDWVPPAATNLANIHFLMGYEPGYSGRYPVFDLRRLEFG